MLLVATEIVAYLVMAAALGFVTAWALRGAMRRRNALGASSKGADSSKRETELSAQLAQRDEQIAALQQRLATMEQATHAASAQLIKTANYGEIPRFLEQLGVGAPRAVTRAGSEDYDGATGNLFEDDLAREPTPVLLRDDLKKVRGIGPRFERMLNELGVHSFKQIALWSDTDIAKYARELHTFPERLRRDEWIRSAREQHLLKYGERL